MIDEQNILKKIEQDIQAHHILLYMKGSKEIPMCGFSARAVQILKVLGADFTTRNVLEDNELRSAIKVHSNWPTIPQLYINSEFIGGCDIIEELYERGELEQMVKASV